MKKYILSIDSGTTGVTVLLVDKKLNVVKKTYSELKQYYPQPGWVEHDPEELIQKIKKLIHKAVKDYSVNDIASIGITNQRETVVVWDKNTGKAIYNAIVWQCRRTEKYCKELEKHKKTVFKFFTFKFLINKLFNSFKKVISFESPPPNTIASGSKV